MILSFIINSENEYIETNRDTQLISLLRNQNGMEYQKVSKQILPNYVLSKYLFYEKVTLVRLLCGRTPYCLLEQILHKLTFSSSTDIACNRSLIWRRNFDVFL